VTGTAVAVIYRIVTDTGVNPIYDMRLSAIYTVYITYVLQ